ncbi:stonustoxin subunit alpha-like [Sardina pilchardus]|uniref:stonustoxin subunit alpha-like n=1 Tax=Sardina pilchardus TaxID=27697 RepID=UPI002E117F23
MLRPRAVLGEIGGGNTLSIPTWQKGGVEKATKVAKKRPAERDVPQSATEKKRVNEQPEQSKYSVPPSDVSTQTLLSESEIKVEGTDWMTGDVAQYSCKLTLDSHSVYSHIRLSEGETKAVFEDHAQPHPDHPERFDTWPQVLCKEGLSDGRFCWEVKWDRYAAIGVAYKSIARKGKDLDCGLGFTKKSWSLLCEEKKYFAWHNNYRSPITEQPGPPGGSECVWTTGPVP